MRLIDDAAGGRVRRQRGSGKLYALGARDRATVGAIPDLPAGCHQRSHPQPARGCHQTLPVGLTVAEPLVTVPPLSFLPHEEPMTIRSTAALLTVLTTFALGTLPAVAADPTPAPSGSPAEEVKPTVLESGLQYIDTVVGTGATPKKGQRVAIHYTAAIGNKRIEASSPAAPFEFVIGGDQAMQGLDEGVSTMKVGGKRKIMVPPELGYGKEEVGNVPPSSIIVYDVELVRIVK